MFFPNMSKFVYVQSLDMEVLNLEIFTSKMIVLGGRAFGEVVRL